MCDLASAYLRLREPELPSALADLHKQVRDIADTMNRPSPFKDSLIAAIEVVRVNGTEDVREPAWAFAGLRAA